MSIYKRFCHETTDREGNLEDRAVFSRYTRSLTVSIWVAGIVTAPSL